MKIDRGLQMLFVIHYFRAILIPHFSLSLSGCMQLKQDASVLKV